ncbi:MAG: hypothetical protein KatS3mg111_3919 [Pirellulaceae bacterium]|nr:MAG: hypothetical protein KatS3mg111_3919 [Pirellulaceae bacterium]
MAKTDDAPQANETNDAAPASAPQEGQQPAQNQPRQAPVQVQVKDDNVTATYANFCRVTGSPEELIIDFGLNPQPVGVPKDPIQVNQRVVMNFYTAKRLLAALQMSVQRHEQVFGVLETDIQKRLKIQQS